MKLEMVVEWSRGSYQRYDWKDGVLTLQDRPWPKEWGTPPVNYGLVPGLLNPADQAEVDAIWPGEPVAVGTHLRGTLLGMVWLCDGDHKLILGDDGHAALDHNELFRWFEGRSPRIASAVEAEAFVRLLPLISGRCSPR
jgi:inorganic pyrophosphatase